jgi:hypothetical protein
VEQLSVPSSYFLDVFSILKSSSFEGRLCFWKQSEDIRSHVRGIGWVFYFSNGFLGHKLLDRELLVSWSIVMVENPIVGPNFRPFSTYSFTIQLQYLHIISLVDCLALWNEFKVNRTRDIEEGDKYCHYL